MWEHVSPRCKICRRSSSRNDRSPLMGATGSPIRAGLHTYKEPKTLSLLFHGSSTSLTAVLFSGDPSTDSNDIIGLGRPAT
jgi:hypothetical protein